MDAAVASIETNASQIQASAKQAAERLIADLKKQRDEFHANVKANAEASGVVLQANKAPLESQWHGFEAQVRIYIETAWRNRRHTTDRLDYSDRGMPR
jgi:hypothetical protein